MADVPLQFDPISSGTRLYARSPINAIVNPAVIPILTRTPSRSDEALDLSLKEKNCARIVVSAALPAGERVVWSIESVHLSSGRREAQPVVRARFHENGKTRLKAGSAVRVYGVTPGRVRITAAARGGADTLEALVVSQRALPVRVQLLRDEAEPLRGTRATARRALAHLRIANIYLRQIGVRLVADRNADLGPSARACMENGRRLPGFFEVRVPAAHVRDVPNDGAPEVICHNARPGVVQICYLESMRSGASGRSINYPANRHGGRVSLTYRAMAGQTVRRHTMVLTPARLQPKRPDIWGLVLTNVNERNDPAFTLQKYANTLAHEIGHLLDLAHRDADADDPKNDGLTRPGGRNLMHAASQPPEAEDLDLLQAMAAHGSGLFPQPHA